MKSNFLLLFILFFGITLSAQEKTLFKTWSGKNLEYIKIDSKKAYFEIFGGYLNEKRYHIIGDTLRLYDEYTSSRDNYSKKHTDNFDFLIKKLTTKKLELLPLDSNALDISKGKKN